MKHSYSLQPDDSSVCVRCGHDRNDDPAVCTELVECDFCHNPYTLEELLVVETQGSDMHICGKLDCQLLALENLAAE